MVLKLRNLNQLKKKPMKEFEYKGMLFHQGSSSSESLARMLINGLDYYPIITYSCYEHDMKIEVSYKAMGGKIIPFKVEMGKY